MPVIVLFIAVFFSAGVSAAAEASLPGDLLYPVKVKVNEEVRGWFAVSHESEAKWETRRAERRLEEVEELAAKGELKADVAARIEENFKAHADRVEARIADFEARDDLGAAADAASHFESSLNAHEDVLVRLRGGVNAEVRSALKDIEKDVDVRANAAVEARAKVEAKAAEDSHDARVKAEFQAAAEGKFTAATNKLDEVTRFLEERGDELSAKVKAEAEVKLKLAADAILAGRAKLEAEAYAEARAKFDEAHRLAMEAKKFVQALLELELKAEAEADDNDNRPENSQAGGQGKAKGKLELNLGL